MRPLCSLSLMVPETMELSQHHFIIHVYSCSVMSFHAFLAAYHRKFNRQRSQLRIYKISYGLTDVRLQTH